MSRKYINERNKLNDQIHELISNGISKGLDAKNIMYRVRTAVLDFGRTLKFSDFDEDFSEYLYETFDRGLLGEKSFAKRQQMIRDYTGKSWTQWVDEFLEGIAKKNGWKDRLSGSQPVKKSELLAATVAVTAAESPIATIKKHGTALKAGMYLVVEGNSILEGYSDILTLDASGESNDRDLLKFVDKVLNGPGGSNRKVYYFESGKTIFVASNVVPLKRPGSGIQVLTEDYSSFLEVSGKVSVVSLK